MTSAEKMRAKRPRDRAAKLEAGRLSPVVQVVHVLAELGDEERAVLLVLARRLLAGQRAYGRLKLARDPRDFRRERAEELADAMVYTAIGEVAAMLAPRRERAGRRDAGSR
jgi:hypothetical protein